jgi:transposase-like protein
MVRSFLGNGRKHYGTGSSRERHDRASAAPPVRARWRGQAVRAAIQRSQASLAQLSQELGINPKTVAKWRKQATVEDMKTGPTEPQSTVLTEAEEAAIVAFRRHTLLPLDDCLYALQPSIPHLTRSGVPPLKWSTNWDSMIPFQEDQRWLESETNPKRSC